jgi:hypothetical protein
MKQMALSKDKNIDKPFTKLIKRKKKKFQMDIIRDLKNEYYNRYL